MSPHLRRLLCAIIANFSLLIGLAQLKEILEHVKTSENTLVFM